MYKREITNTTNTMYGPPGSNKQPYPNDNYPNNAISPPSLSSSPLPPPHNHGYPNEPNPNVSYSKYSTHTTTRTTHGNGPHDEKQPLLAPPFPTDGIEITNVDGHPPKRLDDLLATFDDVRLFMYCIYFKYGKFTVYSSF